MSNTQAAVPMSSAIMGPQNQNTIYSKCECCVNTCKWIPVLFIACVLLWGYYAYVVQLCIITMESVILKIVCLIVFHILYVMTLWSYWQTIFTTSAVVPRNFWFTFSDFDKLQKETTEDARIQVISEIVSSRQLPVICRTYTGNYRLCEKCNLIKPDRAHHCSVCGRCILKMDHHCPWVNNCVSYSNYKFFVLFLGYAFFMCLFAASTSFYYFLKSWQSNSPNWGKFHILFLFFVSIMFAISLVSLFGYHIYLVLLNRSTLESFRAPVFSYGPDKNAFNLGKYHNFCQIFGMNWKSWFLPLSTSVGDGVHYPISIRQEHVQDLQASQSVEIDRQNDSSQQTQMLSPTHNQTNFYNSITGCNENNSGQWSSADVAVPMPTEENARLVTESRTDERRTKIGGDDDMLVPV